jgi:hypothetical protein
VATAKARYATLTRARDNVLRQAREAARLTIPGLIPAEGSSDPHDVTEQPYTSVGARGVNNISAKLLLTLFPPERPFFRLDIDPDVVEDLGSGLGEAQAALAGISHKAMIAAEMSSSRTVWMEVLRHLVVAGNALVYHPVEGTKMRLWRLDQYVVKRSSQGDLLEAIIKEMVFPSELGESVRSATGVQFNEEKPEEEKPVEVYTWIKRVGENLEHYQEINGAEVPGSRGSAKATEAGWQALRWQEVPGSDYGRAYVTEYAGDFLTLEDAAQAVLKFAAEAARILRIVDPNAGIDVEELAQAESGDFLTGFADRISTLQLDKDQDFNTVWEVMKSVERRLSQAFLLASNTIRDAERVTAEEIRAVAQELEDALGGTYTVLSAEVQRPYANRLLYILSKNNKAPKLPPSVVPVIITGFSALGRNQETAALRDWLQDIIDTLGQKFVDTRLNGAEIARRLGVGRGVLAVETLMLDDETVAQNEQAGMMAEGVTRAAPQIAAGVMEAANAPENPIVQ